MSYLCPNCNRCLRVVGFSWQEAQQLVVRDLWRKDDWRAANRLLVVQTFDSAGQAKVLKAHVRYIQVCVKT